MNHPTFLHGSFDGMKAGEFCSYAGYKDKSCTLTLLPTDGYICKDKPQRSKRKALHEYASLHVWNRLLGEEKIDGFDVSSPTPLAIDSRCRIYMTFHAGVPGSQAMSASYSSDMSREERRQTRLVFAEHVGRLLKIKDRENLAHGDFQPRHVLFNSFPVGLSVIDVEHTHISLSDKNKEHELMLRRLRGTVKDSDRWLRAVNDRFDKGYETTIDSEPRVKDIVEQIRTDLKLTAFTLE